MKTLQDFKAFVTAAKNKDPIASTIQQSSRFANKEFTTESESFTSFKFLHPNDQRKLDKNMLQDTVKNKDPIASTIQESSRLANKEFKTESESFASFKFLHPHDQRKFDKNMLQDTVKNKSRPWYVRLHMRSHLQFWALLATIAWLPIGSCAETEQNQYDSINFETFLKMFFWGTGITLSLLNILVHPIWNQIGTRLDRMRGYNLLARNLDDQEQQEDENLVEVTVNQ